MGERVTNTKVIEWDNLYHLRGALKKWVFKKVSAVVWSPVYPLYAGLYHKKIWSPLGQNSSIKRHIKMVLEATWQGLYSTQDTRRPASKRAGPQPCLSFHQLLSEKVSCTEQHSCHPPGWHYLSDLPLDHLSITVASPPEPPHKKMLWPLVPSLGDK